MRPRPSPIAAPALLLQPLSAYRPHGNAPIVHPWGLPLAQGLAGPCHWVEIGSLYGHDAFLKEAAVINPIIGQALQEIRT